MCKTLLEIWSGITGVKREKQSRQLTCLKSWNVSLRSTPGWAGTSNNSVRLSGSTLILSLYSSPASRMWRVKSTTWQISQFSLKSTRALLFISTHLERDYYRQYCFEENRIRSFYGQQSKNTFLEGEPPLGSWSLLWTWLPDVELKKTSMIRRAPAMMDMESEACRLKR